MWYQMDNHTHTFDKHDTCTVCYLSREELFIQASGELPDPEYIPSEGDYDG